MRNYLLYNQNREIVDLYLGWYNLFSVPSAFSTYLDLLIFIFMWIR